ncbi:MAG: hypothetical protein P9X22_06425 [Candidatus Zapsychrus exili]|nr:hypothetical protein [Candidatus Zapsychrus exili]
MIKKYSALFLCLLVTSTSCSPVSTVIQPQINGLVIGGKFNSAIKVMEDNKEGYGYKNRLLYYMDYGLVLHLVKRYKESIIAFERAKSIYDGLFTVSLSSEGSAWLVNDYSLPYRGEDFERVMINIFQAINFACLGDIGEALVEARDVDSKLFIINSHYENGQRNVYKEDAFARFLMGIFYESQDTMEGFNDALISYRKAIDIYEDDYSANYGLEIPYILKENILAVSEMIDADYYRKYRNKFNNIDFVSLVKKKNKAEIYLIHYVGFSPIKHQVSITIPVPNGFITKLAFPEYYDRSFSKEIGVLKAVSDTGKVFEAKTFVSQDIGSIAINNLKNRKSRVIAKAALRAGLKYFIAESVAGYLKENHGENASKWSKYISNLYNISSEQADLRSWQTLPSEIRITRLILNSGNYRLFFDEDDLGEIDIKENEKKFIVYRKTGY